jgi:DNA-binding NtrC family response regulator
VDKGADGGWRDLIAETTAMGLALPVIVVSAKADERLWVDALSAGAYDALEIPFHRGETRRVLLTAVQGGDRGAAHIRRRACHVGSFGRRAAAMAAAAVLPA